MTTVAVERNGSARHTAAMVVEKFFARSGASYPNGWYPRRADRCRRTGMRDDQPAPQLLA